MLCLLPALVCWCVLLGLLEDLLANLFRGSRCSGHLHHFGALNCTLVEKWTTAIPLGLAWQLELTWPEV